MRTMAGLLLPLLIAFSPEAWGQFGAASSSDYEEADSADYEQAGDDSAYSDYSGPKGYSRSGSRPVPRSVPRSAPRPAGQLRAVENDPGDGNESDADEYADSLDQDLSAITMTLGPYEYVSGSVRNLRVTKRAADGSIAEIRGGFVFDQYVRRDFRAEVSQGRLRCIEIGFSGSCHPAITATQARAQIARRKAAEVQRESDEAAFDSRRLKPPANLAQATVILEKYVAEKSRYWQFNRYDAGSMKAVNLLKSSSSPLYLLIGEYRFNQGQSGSVSLVLRDGVVVCTRYWDSSADCRRHFDDDIRRQVFALNEAYERSQPPRQIDRRQLADDCVAQATSERALSMCRQMYGY